MPFGECTLPDCPGVSRYRVSIPTGIADCSLGKVLTYKNLIYLLNLKFFVDSHKKEGPSKCLNSQKISITVVI